jgi:effector-binding domain-containing protein
MANSVIVIRAEAVCTAVIRGIVPRHELSRFVPAACGEVWAFIRAAKLPRPGRHVAVYLDGDGSVEVGAEVSESFEGNERVHCSRLPAGRVATAVYYGPYAGLGQAHAGVQRWCAENSCCTSGVCWEIYGHWEESWNADPSRIRTDLFYLLQD